MAGKFKSIKLLFSLWALHAKMDLNWLTRDTKYCLLNMSADIVSSISAIAGVFLLSQSFGKIGGMDNDKILFMLSYATITDGILVLFYGNSNVVYISRIIGRGQIDHMIVQPLTFWMQLLTDGFIPFSGSSKLLCGVSLAVYSLIILEIPVTLLWVSILILNLLSSVAIVISISYITGSIAFYAPVAGEEVSTTAVDLFNTLKPYPLGGLPKAVKFIFLSILPVALTAWYPSDALLTGKTGFSLFITFIAAVILSLIASICFKKGMIYYAKYGSTRYLDRGHRR